MAQYIHFSHYLCPKTNGILIKTKIGKIVFRGKEIYRKIVLSDQFFCEPKNYLKTAYQKKKKAYQFFK